MSCKYNAIKKGTKKTNKVPLEINNSRNKKLKRLEGKVQ